tara:strand:- start:314 stop:895 length:582 start_codon:yes stop_codon:yes gene_type:complete
MINRKTIQITLLFIGFILILSTYFLYPKITQQEVLESEIIDESFKTTDEESNKFENVEYKGMYNLNKPFTVKSKSAYILNEEPDLVYMSKMHVTIYMDDGRVVVITSDEGKYNKSTYDCYFINNVKATDGDTKVLSKNLDLLSSENTAQVYNDVILTNESGSLKADKVDYNFDTKYYKVSMFKDERVKVKLIK